jgi:hypothetical protein
MPVVVLSKLIDLKSRKYRIEQEIWEALKKDNDDEKKIIRKLCIRYLRSLDRVNLGVETRSPSMEIIKRDRILLDLASTIKGYDADDLRQELAFTYITQESARRLFEEVKTEEEITKSFMLNANSIGEGLANLATFTGNRPKHFVNHALHREVLSECKSNDEDDDDVS